MVPFSMTLGDLAKYPMTRSTRGLSATAELLVLLTMWALFLVACFFVSLLTNRLIRGKGYSCCQETFRTLRTMISVITLIIMFRGDL